MFDLSKIKKLSIPIEGIVTRIINIKDNAGNILWKEINENLNYFYVESLEDGNNVSVVKNSSSANTISLEYSKDKSTWNTWDLSSSITLNNGEKLYIRGDNTVINNSSSNYNYFKFTKQVNLGGNIMSLIDKTCELIDLSNKMYCFSHIFYNCNNVKSIDELLLPATSLASCCYYYMFQNCSLLTIIPDNLLPATTLANLCYSNMFYNCSSLTTIPSNLLPATTLTSQCYSAMFRSCSSLTTIPDNLLPATTLASQCYQFMFQNCSLLTIIPDNLLPATTLASQCYSSMFYNCSSLTTIPSNLLPATTLTSSCYSNMFSNCSKLNEITINFNEFNPNNATSNWLANVSSTGTAYCNQELIDKFNDGTYSRGASTIPEGWELKFYSTNTYLYIDDEFVIKLNKSGELTQKDIEDTGYHDNITSVFVGSAITKIGNNAFENCPIHSIVLLNSITSIGDSAFSGCPIEIIDAEAVNNPPLLGTNAFEQPDSIYVSLEGFNSYRTANGWSNYIDVIKTKKYISGYYDLNDTFSTNGNGFEGNSNEPTNINYDTFNINKNIVNLSSIFDSENIYLLNDIYISRDGTLNIDINNDRGITITCVDGTVCGEYLDIGEIIIESNSEMHISNESISYDVLQFNNNISIYNNGEKRTYSIDDSNMELYCDSIIITTYEEYCINNYIICKSITNTADGSIEIYKCDCDNITNIVGGSLTFYNCGDSKELKSIVVGYNSSIEFYADDIGYNEAVIKITEELTVEDGTIIANLTFEYASTLLVNGMQKALHVGGELTLNTNIALDSDTLHNLDSLDDGDYFWLIDAASGRELIYNGPTGEDAWYDEVFSRFAADGDYVLTGNFNIVFSVNDGLGLQKTSRTPPLD